MIENEEEVKSTIEEVFDFQREWLSGRKEFVIRTSGSTGIPKSIRVTREKMSASARGTIEILGLQPGQIAVLCLDPSFIAGKMMIVRALEAKMKLLPLPVSRNPLANYMDDLNGAFMAVVPLQLQAMLQNARSLENINSMHSIIVGGGPLSPELERQLQNVESAVYHTFGMTETLSHIALRPVNGPKASKWFQVLPGIEIQKDEKDCLMIKGAVTDHRWLKTNDVVETGDGKTFRWLGRSDNMINSGGVKLFPEMLEKEIFPIIKTYGRDTAFFLAGMTDRELGQKLVLFLEGLQLNSKEKDDLLKELKNILPDYHAPREVFCLSKFEWTVTGKIKRKATLENISQ